MDNTIPFNLRSTSTNFFNVAGILIVVCAAIPIFTAALVPVALLFYLTQKLYINTARQVKRMESITRSPMYRLESKYPPCALPTVFKSRMRKTAGDRFTTRNCSHFGETLSGAPTIRAYRMLPAFIEENERLVDFNQVSRCTKKTGQIIETKVAWFWDTYPMSEKRFGKVAFTSET